MVESTKINGLANNSWLHFYQMSNVMSGDYLHPLIVKGEDIYLFDANGKKYIDGLSGAYCVNIGYGRKRVIDAMSKAASKIHYVSPFSAANPYAVELASRLSILAKSVVGENARVFFVNSGAEAVETAVKVARAYSYRTKSSKSHKIICRSGAYHGATFGTMAFSGYDDTEKEFGPALPGVMHASNNDCTKCSLSLKYPACDLACASQILNILKSGDPMDFSAVLIEPAGMGSRMISPPPYYLQRVSEICQATDTLLLLDEVVTGFGRLGQWFGAEHFGIKADILICAKGLTSGYDSLAAVIVSQRIADAFLGEDSKMFRNASTFGGRPGAAAAALENIKIYEEEGLLQNARLVSSYLHDLLKAECKTLDIVKNISCEGMLFNIEINSSQPAQVKSIRKSLIKKGLITSLYYGRHSADINLAPPLTLSSKQAEAIVNILLNSFKG